MPIPVLCECGRYFDASDGSVGHLARCPACGRQRVVTEPEPRPAPAPDDMLVISEEFAPPRTSGAATASLVLGLLFVFACLSGVPAILLGWIALRDIRESGGRLRGRGRAKVGIALGLVGCLLTVALLMPAVRSAREAARRSQCVNNLKQIGLALHNYHSAHDRFPPAAIVGKDGRPLLSWRVAILPYLESGKLYEKFHLDEPWDSPHNLALLDQMPTSYACPTDTNLGRGMTGYQAPVGPSYAFAPDFRPRSFADFPDGLANTILVSESRHGVPWTKPEDFPIDLARFDNGLGSLHSFHNNGFNALFADGSVKFLRVSIAPKDLGAMLTRDGGEAISGDVFAP